jgi:hypothetical protein
MFIMLKTNLNSKKTFFGMFYIDLVITIFFRDDMNVVLSISGKIYD